MGILSGMRANKYYGCVILQGGSSNLNKKVYTPNLFIVTSPRLLG